MTQNLQKDEQPKKELKKNMERKGTDRKIDIKEVKSDGQKANTCRRLKYLFVPQICSSFINSGQFSSNIVQISITVKR